MFAYSCSKQSSASSVLISLLHIMYTALPLCPFPSVHSFGHFLYNSTTSFSLSSSSAATPILSDLAPSPNPHLDVDVVSYVVSYCHVTPSTGRFLNILPSQLPHVFTIIHALCRHAGVSRFRQFSRTMLAARSPSGTMR